jgi:RNA polymerase sigma-70 factor, ECF subfamily
MQDADAQDLVQTVLIRVAGAIDRWEAEPGVRFRHWLRRIARNAIVYAARSRVMRRLREQIQRLEDGER